MLLNRVVKQKCICGKDKETIQVNRLLLISSFVLEIIGLAILLLVILLYGFNEAISLMGVIIVLYAIGLFTFLGVLTYQLGQGHSLKCSARRAAIIIS